MKTWNEIKTKNSMSKTSGMQMGDQVDPTDARHLSAVIGVASACIRYLVAWAISANPANTGFKMFATVATTAVTAFTLAKCIEHFTSTGNSRLYTGNPEAEEEVEGDEDEQPPMNSRVPLRSAAVGILMETCRLMFGL
jgi:hypothetical protein